MISTLAYILLFAAFILWIGLMIIWTRYIRDVTERRRQDATAQGEMPPGIKGVSNYERAELIERAHRDMKITPMERWIGRGLYVAVPAMVLTLFIMHTSV